MTHASLFSGIGGFDLAAQWAGWINLFNCEINPFCQTVLKHHFPNATQYSDIRATDFTVWRGQIDVLTGGFPCQPFSVAGKRKGTDDDRYLWPEMLRAIREISPRFVVGENVRGIINWSKGMVFEQVCADLEILGYEVTPFLIPAVAVNAPHRRDRVWFIAHAKSNGNSGRFKEVLQENGRPIGELHTQPVESGCIRATADPDDKRQSQQSRNSIADRSRQFSRLYAPTGFDTFPTQPPVCRGDDGLSLWLDFNAVFAGIPRPKRASPFPRWRSEAIKGYGNAVVPQIPYIFFKIINQL